jgi:hypothetical protein
MTTMTTQAGIEMFTTLPGKCFRYVEAVNGRARHCPEPVVHTGQFMDQWGKTWTVDACVEHAKELDD